MFRAFRISIEAVERLNMPWFAALKILVKVARQGIAQTSSNQQALEIETLRQHGRSVMGVLRDAKPLLSQILENWGLECTKDELNSIYEDIREMSADTTLSQFENAMKGQMARISMSRNRVLLQEKWIALTGTESVKSWCVMHKAPVQWVVPREYVEAIKTVIEVQKNERVIDKRVVNALQMLDRLDVRLMTDDKEIEAVMLVAVGVEYKDIWQADRDLLISRARQENGADMSMWSGFELISVRKMLKEAQQEKAKKEKLTATQNYVRRMDEAALRSRIIAFLERHPEFCDNFKE